MIPCISIEVCKNALFQALATFTAYASYPAFDCLSQNFVQCGQAIRQCDLNAKTIYFNKTTFAWALGRIEYDMQTSQPTCCIGWAPMVIVMNIWVLSWQIVFAYGVGLHTIMSFIDQNSLGCVKYFEQYLTFQIKFYTSQSLKWVVNWHTLSDVLLIDLTVTWKKWGFSQ